MTVSIIARVIEAWADTDFDHAPDWGWSSTQVTYSVAGGFLTLNHNNTPAFVSNIPFRRYNDFSLGTPIDEPAPSPTSFVDDTDFLVSLLSVPSTVVGTTVTEVALLSWSSATVSFDVAAQQVTYEVFTGSDSPVTFSIDHSKPYIKIIYNAGRFLFQLSSDGSSWATVADLDSPPTPDVPTNVQFQLNRIVSSSSPGVSPNYIIGPVVGQWHDVFASGPIYYTPNLTGSLQSTSTTFTQHK